MQKISKTFCLKQQKISFIELKAPAAHEEYKLLKIKTLEQRKNNFEMQF